MKVTHIKCDQHGKIKTGVAVTLERHTPDDLSLMLVRQAVNCVEANVDHSSKGVSSYHRGLECHFDVEVPVPPGYWPSRPQQLGHHNGPKHD
jgi:hypothetical protein